MINDYSLPKVFCEDLYKAFIFHVEHPLKVFIYKLFMRNIEKLTRLRRYVEKRYLHKEKSDVCFTEKMDEVRARNRIEVKIHQEKVNFINDAYKKELRY